MSTGFSIRRQSVLKWFGHSLAHLVANTLSCILLILLLLMIVVKSESGQLWLLQTAVPKLLESTSYRLITKQPSTRHLGQWSLQHVALLQDNQTVFSADNLFFSIDAGRLLMSAEVDISHLQADYIQLNVSAIERLINDLLGYFLDYEPTGEESVPDKWQFVDYWRSIDHWLTHEVSDLVPVRVLDASVGRLEINYSNESIPALRVSGQLEFAWQDNVLKSRLDVASLEQGHAKLHLSGQFSKRLTGDVALSVREEKAGWLAKYLGLPPKLPLIAHLRSEISRTDDVWQVNLGQLTGPLELHNIALLGTILVDKNAGSISTEQLTLSVNNRRQSVSGHVSRDSLSLHAELTALPVDITSFWQEELTGGSLAGKIVIQGKPEAPEVEAILNLQSHYQGLPVDAQAEASILLSEQRSEIRLRKAKGRLGDLSLAGGGVLDLNRQSMDLDISRAQAPLSYLRLLGIDPVEDLELVLKVAEVKVTGPFTRPVYSGEASTYGTYKGQGFAAASVLEGTIDDVQFSSFELLSGKSRLQASGLLSWTKEQLDLAVSAEQVPLAMLNLLAIAPPREVEALLSAEGTVKGGFWLPQFVGKASATGSYQEQGESVRFSMNALLQADPQKVTVYESLADLNFLADSTPRRKKLPSLAGTTLRANGEYRIDDQWLNASFQFEALPLSVYRLAGLTFPYQASGAFAGDLQVKGTFPQPRVSGSLNGSGLFDDRPFTMEVVGSGEPENLFIKAAQVSWGEARLVSKGSLQQGISDFAIGLSDFNLRELGIFGIDVPAAALDVNLTVHGPSDRPEILGKVALSDLLADARGDDNERRLGWQADISLVKDILLIQNRLDQNAAQQGAFNIALPWSEYYRWYKETRAQGEKQLTPRQKVDFPMLASIQGQIDLAWMETFLAEDTHEMAGIVSIDLVTKGLFYSPVVNGIVRLEQGRYSNQLTRTSLEQGEFDLLFAGQRLDIGTGKASDGDTGRLLARGFVDWSKDNPAEDNKKSTKINVSVNTKGVRLLRRDELEGEASGQLAIIGDFDRLLVEGDIEVSPLRVVLDILNDASIPELDVVVVELADPSSGDKDESIFPEIDLNVIMRANQQAYVRGRGLNAELAGLVRIAGGLEDPDYRGKFAVVRGTFDLFGKRFVLAEGDVFFENDTVSVYIEGRFTDENYQYLVTISGGLNDLTIALSTQPDLPQDEAISRLLFGKSVQSITAFQAVRLAQAVQELTGKSSGFDPIASTRDVLKLDDLTVDSAKSESGTGVSVGVGKYINERVYVELERSADAAQPWQGSIEVELSPKLVLEGSTDDVGGSSVDLKWKYDY